MPLPPPAPAGRQILDADNSGGLDGNEFCLAIRKLVTPAGAGAHEARLRRTGGEAAFLSPPGWA